MQVQQSSFVVYGTPLPPLDESIRDDGSYVPVWKQEVTDEQGRKRLHGAFTGGFSAGYFNTVGSQEGWTPSTFVSSRTNRKRDAPQEQQRPEDFMDDEDRADAEEAKKLQTADTFAGLGPVDERPSSEPFMDLMKTTGETMGVRLLKKMGWRDGQGVGPKIRRKARLEEDQLLGVLGGQDATTETHLFAPANSNIIAFVRKKDRKGLGYDDQTGIAKIENETVESKSTHLLGVEEDMDGRIGTLTMKNKPRKKKKEGKGGIGIGILNDTGSDDEDPYSMGPSISYNRVIGGDKKKKKKVEAVRSSANPLLSSKPIFISKKAGAAKGSSGLRRCHDGRLPLDGFVLSSDPDPRNSIVSQDGKFPPPKIPEDWKSSRSPSNAAASTSVQNSYQSAARVAAAAKLSPKSRAALLGEVQLPGKSVFDYLNPAARNRIASATNNYNLPPALSEADSKSSGASTKTLASLVPQLARETALTALGRGTAGWMPYAEDSGKRARYRTFLEIRASLRPEGTLPERAPGASNDDWINEMNEFAHAAEIFKPMTGAMASRFTSSSSTPKLASDNVKLEGVTDGTKDPPFITQHPAKSKTPAEEAAAVGMYGPLTRSVENFYPSRLLCKRFNVKPPSHVQMDPSDAPLNGSTEGESRDGKGPPLTHSTALPQKRLELVGKKDMDELRMSGGGMPQVERALSAAEQAGIATAKESIAVDPERNEALEKERPGEAVFRAIFGSDSEDG